VQGPDAEAAIGAAAPMAQHQTEQAEKLAREADEKRVRDELKNGELALEAEKRALDALEAEKRAREALDEEKRARETEGLKWKAFEERRQLEEQSRRLAAVASKLVKVDNVSSLN